MQRALLLIAATAILLAVVGCQGGGSGVGANGQPEWQNKAKTDPNRSETGEK